MDNVKKVIVGLCLSLCLPFSVRAQFVQDFNPPPSPCCLPGAAAHLADELQDWNQLGRYHQDDLRLESSARRGGPRGIPGRFDNRRMGFGEILSGKTLREPWHQWTNDHADARAHAS